MSEPDLIGGVPLKDPFRWLEDDADPKVVDWQKRANEKTAAELAASPHAAVVSAAVRATFEDLFATSAPQRHGDFWFRKVAPPGRSNVVLEVFTNPTGKGRVLFDPSEDGASASLAVVAPSPDGKLVMIGTDVSGAFKHRVISTDDGAVVRAFPNIVHPTGVSWTHDNSGFYYQSLQIQIGADGKPAPQMEVCWQPLSGDSERQDLELDHPASFAEVSSDGRWVGVKVDQTAPRLVWIKRVGGNWQRFAPGATAMYKGAIIGDDYWAISNDTSGWCRLIAIPLETSGDKSTWRELLPARDEVKLISITQCGSYVALSTIEAGTMRLKALNLAGEELGDVPLPSDGAFGPFGMGHILAIMLDIVAPDGDGATFVHSSPARGCGVYRADLATRTLEQVEAPAHVLADRDVQRVTTDGPHGPISYWVMRKDSTQPDRSTPIIVSGYGGFNVPHIPHYSAMAAAWTELGGVWVHAQLRGGGERDTEFWHAGRKHRKQGTFDDFFAVIEDLHARGVSSPERTGIWGTSNGGLLVGATVSQRPDLLRAAVAQVPILDLVRFKKDPVTASVAKADYGDPENDDDAAVMHAYSPYHNLRAGVRYPALLCDAGATDTSCPPWHSRKMVAAVEGASSSGRRVRLRVREGSGHNQMTNEHFIQRDIEELTFFCDELMS